MPAITLSEVKSILNITDSTKDSLITTLIPVCTEYIKNYCNTRFYDSKVYCENDTIDFLATNKINISTDYSFVDYKFSAGMEIEVTDSILNDGLYTIASVTAQQITLNETTITTEDNDITININRVKYPQSIKMLLAQMINESIVYANNNIGGNVTSVRLGDYAVSYSSSGNFSNDLKSNIRQTIGRFASVK
jgi:hypothetical protein